MLGILGLFRDLGDIGQAVWSHFMGFHCCCFFFFVFKRSPHLPQLLRGTPFCCEAPVSFVDNGKWTWLFISMEAANEWIFIFGYTHPLRLINLLLSSFYIIYMALFLYFLYIKRWHDALLKWLTRLNKEQNRNISRLSCSLILHDTHSLWRASRRTAERGAPPARTDTAPAPANDRKRLKWNLLWFTGLHRNGLDNDVFHQLPTSFVFLSIFCRRMRKLWGSLFTSSSKHQRFMHRPASQTHRNTQIGTYFSLWVSFWWQDSKHAIFYTRLSCLRCSEWKQKRFRHFLSLLN